MQPTESPHAFLMHIVNAQIEQDPLAFLINFLRNFTGYLLNNLFDPRRMNPAVEDKPLQRRPRNFFADRIKTGNDDRFRRIVNDDIRPRKRFQSADISSFAADYPAFHFVAGQTDGRNRNIAGRFRCKPLNRRNQNIARPFFCRKLGFLLDLVDDNKRIMLCVRFQIADYQILCLLLRQARNLFQLSPVSLLFAA